jgi:hypothetical protein
VVSYAGAEAPDRKALIAEGGFLAAVWCSEDGALGAIERAGEDQRRVVAGE